MGALALAAGVVAVLLLLATQVLPSPEDHGGPALAQPMSAAPVVAAAPSAAAPAPSDVQAARIETLPEAAIVSAAASAVPPEAVAVAAAAPADAAASAVAATTEADRSAAALLAMAAAPTAAGAVVSPAAAPAPEAANTRPVDKPRAKDRSKGGAGAPAGTASNPRVAKRRDSDVDIVAALIAHEDARLAAASRPVAEGPGSIAELVSACKRSDKQQSLACKARICRGYWGKAEACPAGERARALRAAKAVGSAAES